MRRLVAVLALSSLALAACGGSSDTEDAAETTAAAAAETTAAAAETTAAPASTTSAPATASTAAAAATTAAATAGATTVDAVLTEWKIAAPTTVKAGKVTVNVSNNGQFKHELVIFKGTYASLPRQATGAVDENQLAAGVLIAEVEDLDGGAKGSVTVDLAAGQYTFICNLAGGGSSHASRGQVLDITVS